VGRFEIAAGRPWWATSLAAKCEAVRCWQLKCRPLQWLVLSVQFWLA
jgi:hypothetical protein